jgi:hypothetical protein
MTKEMQGGYFAKKITVSGGYFNKMQRSTLKSLSGYIADK